MARFYYLTPLERRVTETLVDKARMTVVEQYRFNASQVLAALNGSGTGVSEDDVAEILSRLDAASMITLQADRSGYIYSLIERGKDFAIHALLDNAVPLKEASRETVTLHRVEAEILRTISEHDGLTDDVLAKILEPLTAPGADGARPPHLFTKWLEKNCLVKRVGEIGTFSVQFPPLQYTAAPWVSRLGVRDEGVTVDRLFRLTSEELDHLYLAAKEIREQGVIEYPGIWLNRVCAVDSGRKWHYTFLGPLRPLMHITGNGTWKLSPEFARYRFVVMDPLGVRFKTHAEDLPDSYTAHPDHAYWQLAVLAGKATEVKAEHEMGTVAAVPSKDAPAPPAPVLAAPAEPAPEPEPPAALESASAAEASPVPALVVTDAVREDAEASRDRVLHRKDDHVRVLGDWERAQEVHAVELEKLRADVDQLRAELARKEAELRNLEASSPVAPSELALREAEFRDAIRRHNAAFGDVLLLDNMGTHVVLPIPVAAPPVATPPPSSPPSSEPPAAPAAPVAASGGNGSAATPHSGNGMTEWNDTAKDAFVESVLAAGMDRRQEVVDAFIAAHPAFKAMSVRAVASRMTGGFQDWFCKSYLKDRTGSDRTRAIHRLATFYKAAPADITRLVGPAR